MIAHRIPLDLMTLMIFIEGHKLCSSSVVALSDTCHFLSLGINVSLYGCTALVDLGRFFLMYTQSVGLLGGGDQPVARPQPTHRTIQTQNKRA
jgi:hypothetical protein